MGLSVCIDCGTTGAEEGCEEGERETEENKHIRKLESLYTGESTDLQFYHLGDRGGGRRGEELGPRGL